MPYRALQPHKVEGLLVVGKATAGGVHLGILRNGAFQGQAAGTAAARAAKTGTSPRALDIKKLQDTLRDPGLRFQPDKHVRVTG